MKITTLTGWAAGIMLMICSGCGGTGTLVPRGQSPDLQTVYENQNQNQNQIQTVGYRRHANHAHGPVAHARQELHGKVSNHFNGTQQTWHSEPMRYHSSYGGGYGSPQAAHCPSYEAGTCQPNNPRCPLRIHHHHTYDVKRIHNSVYPAQGQPGGVVTYPYYTHKGPSSFFYNGD